MNKTEYAPLMAATKTAHDAAHALNYANRAAYDATRDAHDADHAYAKRDARDTDRDVAHDAAHAPARAYAIHDIVHAAARTAYGKACITHDVARSHAYATRASYYASRSDSDRGNHDVSRAIYERACVAHDSARAVYEQAYITA